MTDILEEILHDQSDEKKVYFFKRILPIVIIITIIIIIVMLIRNKQQEKTDKENIRLSTILMKSIDNNDDKTVEEALEDIIKTGKNSRIVEIAQLRKVGIKMAQNDSEEVKKLLQDIINNQQYLPLTQSFARIAWLSIMIDRTNLSNGEREQIQEYLSYFKDYNQEFFATASLLKALWYESNNQINLAKEALKNIHEVDNLSQVIQEQAKALISRIDIRSDVEGK
ncbi:MAG: DUF2659 family protein [Janthinobacterium lividum]